MATQAMGTDVIGDGRDWHGRDGYGRDGGVDSAVALEAASRRHRDTIPLA